LSAHFPVVARVLAGPVLGLDGVGDHHIGVTGQELGEALRVVLRDDEGDIGQVLFREGMSVPPASSNAGVDPGDGLKLGAVGGDTHDLLGPVAHAASRS
jgi:hypothetical protein